LSDYQVRAAGFEGYSALVRELGGDPDPLLRQAGVDPAWLEDPEHPVSYIAFLMALRLGAQATATPHFGLLLSRKQRFAMLGAVGFAVREAPNVHAAIENLNRFLPIHSAALRTSLVVERDLARWTLGVLLTGAPPAEAQSGAVKSRAAIEQIIKDSGADVAVAFRTVDGPAGAPARLELLIQPDVPFHAASTMKVPVMIELFR